MNFKFFFILYGILCFVFSPAYTQNGGEVVTLFDGENLDQWVMYGDDPGFIIKDDLIVSTVQNGDNLFTRKKFGNYRLQLEYFLSEVGNSGVLIRCDPADAWTSGVEVQLLAPWTPYRDDLHCTASLYGHVAVTNRPDETTGVWHQMEILCDRNIIRISVDGKMATEVDVDTVESMRGKFLEGSIGLQSNHGEPTEFVHFKNIVIENFDEIPEYVIQGFSENNVHLRQQAHQAALRLGETMIPYLIPLLSSGDRIKETGAKQVLYDMISQTIRSPHKKQRKNMKKAINQYRKKASAEKERQDLDELLRMF